MPTSTYRLQFREGMDFDRAAGLVPYLVDLGISHLYASPLFTATTGSTHGYDVTDPGEIEPALGGRAGLEQLSAALKTHGMGLVLDIVPNHMAFTVETPWLRDVLRHGSKSRYARHFDTDPDAARLRLPWLGAPFETLVSVDQFGVEDDSDGPVLALGGLRVPLAATPGLEAARETPSPEAIRALHAEQPWRLVHWRTERDAITHRRFFNVTSLIGVRVEDETVFEDVHALLFDLIGAGLVDGVRIDHIDGLADPAAYLDRLAPRIPDTPVWVEKILSGSERLPESWPVEGTTGYGTARAFARLLTDADGLERVHAAYRDATGRTDPMEDVLTRAKRQIMTQDLAAELWTLHAMVVDAAATDPIGLEYGPEALREALIDLIGAFPRYRTYMTARKVSDEDADLILRAAAEAVSQAPDPGALQILADLLTRSDAATAPLRLRFQQVTGAATAKSQEDTAFYREIRLLSANEVGGEPDDEPLGVAGFHRAMERRASQMPHGLTLTSSHDTKRSEDARMRIAAISHAPDAFFAFHDACDELAGDDVMPNLRWYLAQTLLALDPGDGDIAARLEAHVEKALREAKRRTFWTDPNPEVEDPARAYARRLAAALMPHPQAVAPILKVADRLTLIQTALQLTVPGIPDIYQGCEIASYSLTDPDNRRPVAFDRLARMAGDVTLGSPLDRAKFELTRMLLGVRRGHPELFLHGAYTRIDAGADICSFARVRGNATLTVVAHLTDSAEAAGAIHPEGTRLWPDKDRASPVHIFFAEPGARP